MPEVTLTGHLICQDQGEAAVVAEHLPVHIALTRAEPGCLLFVVSRTSDPLVWDVEERFTDEASFRTHQERVASSEWGRATAGIARNYSIVRL